jgi:CRP/FNR family transcriptional regulator, cyclic AMP receptor protein
MNPAELFRRDDDPVRLAPGQTLFREGDTGDSMYVLLEGSADVFVGEILVESATPGLLGEMALVDSSPRTAMVVARCRRAWPGSMSAVSIFSFNRRPISLRT